jgi:hypothetical protein
MHRRIRNKLLWCVCSAHTSLVRSSMKNGAPVLDLPIDDPFRYSEIFYERAYSSLIRGATYFCLRNFFTFFRRTCFSSDFRGGCCRRDVGPLLVNIIRTPRKACVRYLCGKRKNSSLEPMGHWNHSFSDARHSMSRIPSASSAVFLFVLESHILLSQFGP